jgi:hypothetical protein
MYLMTSKPDTRCVYNFVYNVSVQRPNPPVAVHLAALGSKSFSCLSPPPTVFLLFTTVNPVKVTLHIVHKILRRAWFSKLSHSTHRSTRSSCLSSFSQSSEQLLGSHAYRLYYIKRNSMLSGLNLEKNSGYAFTMIREQNRKHRATNFDHVAIKLQRSTSVVCHITNDLHHRS